MSDNEYPKVSDSTGWVRIDFSSRECAQFRKRDGEKPYFYAVGRGGAFVDVQGLENNDIRRFAEGILRRFPETAPEPLPEYEVVIDLANDEWVKVGEDAYVSVFATGTRAESATSDLTRWTLFEIAQSYGIKAVGTVTGEEAR